MLPPYISAPNGLSEVISRADVAPTFELTWIFAFVHEMILIANIETQIILEKNFARHTFPTNKDFILAKLLIATDRRTGFAIPRLSAKSDLNFMSQNESNCDSILYDQVFL